MYNAHIWKLAEQIPGFDPIRSGGGVPIKKTCGFSYTMAELSYTCNAQEKALVML